MIKLKGIPASNGIASGPAYIFHHTEVGVKRETISDPSAELARLEIARNTARDQLKALKKDRNRSQRGRSRDFRSAHDVSG